MTPEELKAKLEADEKAWEEKGDVGVDDRVGWAGRMYEPKPLASSKYRFYKQYNGVVPADWSVTPLVNWLIVFYGVMAYRMYYAEAPWGRFKFYGTAFFCLILSIKCHHEPLEDMTLQDRALLKIRELLGGAAPCDGQIAVVLHCDKKAPTVEKLIEKFERIAREGDRFHMVAHREGWMWQTCFKPPTFTWSMKDHVKESVEYTKTLDECVQFLANEQLPRTQPEWRMDILRCPDGEAVVYRMSHALGDGLRMLKMAKDILAFEDGEPAEIPAVAKMNRNKEDAAEATRTNGENFKDFLTAATLAMVPNETCDAFHQPGQVLENDPERPRTHVMADTVELADVKAIRTALGEGSLNDVILTALCGALRKYADGLDGSASGTVRAMCAVSLPDDDDRFPNETYNAFVMPSTSLPVFGYDGDTPKRFAAVRAATAVLKRSRAGYVSAVLVALMEKVGLDAFAGRTQKKIMGKHSLVYSNLPGFEKPVVLCESKIARIGVFFPNLLTQLSFLSYDGRLSLSVSADAKVTKNPEKINEFFHAEIAEWKAAVVK